MKRVDHPMMIYRGVFTKKQVIERVRVKGCMFGLVLDNNRLTFTLFLCLLQTGLVLTENCCSEEDPDLLQALHSAEKIPGYPQMGHQNTGTNMADKA